MSFDFNEQLAKDAQDIFLTGDFSQTAILKSGSNITEISIQFFEEPLDKLGVLYHHAWCAYADAPHLVKNKDSLIIDKISYGIVDFTIDETKTGINLFLQKV